MKQADKNFIAINRKARHLFSIEKTVEAGLALTGSEVKSMRNGRANIAEAHAVIEDGEATLLNCHISEYRFANRQNHSPRRPRKLLLHRREIHQLGGMVQRRGYTLVPLSLYFNARGCAKVELGLAKGQRKHDRRETIKERDWQRRKARLVSEAQKEM